jgi:predicted metal-dependent enzyme (double-stranded beta helix superfamily)
VTEELEVWLIGWCPGQSTPLHDHGGAEGALVVVAGALDETIVLPPPAAAHRRSLRPGRAVRLPASRVHRVGNAGSVLATSIHAYSPPGCASLAAVTLRRLGLMHATDVTGGFRAWRRCGLPVLGDPGGCDGA